MKPTVTTKVIDRGWRKILQTMRAVKETHVKAGVLGSTKEREGGEIDNVTLGMVHEFGSPDQNIPERGHIRRAFREHRADYSKSIGRMLPLVYAGKLLVPKALALLGQSMSADIKKTIQDGVPPPLKTKTIERKGSSKPLIDTGQYLNSIAYAVEGSGGHE